MRIFFLHMLFVLWIQNCKNEKPEPNRRIVRGHEMQTSRNFPFYAHIAIHCQSEDGEVKVKECGGTLVNPWWVLTAAHCFEKAKVEHLEITMGASRSYDKNGVSTKVSDFKLHPKYKIHYNSNRVIERIDYDIAVCKVQTPYTLSESIQIVDLPKHNTCSANYTSRCKTGIIIGLSKASTTFQKSNHKSMLWAIEVDSLTRTEDVLQEPSRWSTVFYTMTQVVPSSSMVEHLGGPFLCYEGSHGYKIPVVYGVSSWSRIRNDYKITAFEEVDWHIPFINKHVKMLVTTDGRSNHPIDFFGQRGNSSSNEGNLVFKLFLMFAFILLIL